MVAGSPPRAGVSPGAASLAPAPTLTAAWERHRTVFTAAVLYALGLLLLVLPEPFGQPPAWAYNWEGYTAWRWLTFWAAPELTLGIWAPNDGLMTDSGQGPLLGLPLTLSILVNGFTLEALRLPAMLLSALAVPLLWLCGKRVIGPAPALLAATLLAISPVFLFYGRTATLVGVSLVPLLLTTLGLLRVLDAPARAGWAWRREGALVATMLLGLFAYAPVRLLWPLTVALLALAALRAGRRCVLLLTALGCLVVVPAALMTQAWVTLPQPEPVHAALGYFHARGEQITAMSGDASVAGQYVRDIAPAAESSPWVLAAHLVAQNARDLGRLLGDAGTRPAPTDYWNETGRFWPGWYLPFAVVGALAALGRVVRGGNRALVRALPLLLALGLTLPLLLTSRVHVGRLLPALPFALLLVALGVAVMATQVSRALGRAAVPAPPLLVGGVLAVGVLLPAAWQARAEMAVPLSPTREEQTARLLATWVEPVRERGGAVLVEDPSLGDEIERVHAATFQLALDQQYQFVDLMAASIPAPDDRAQLAWRGALGKLRAGEIDAPCRRLWFVTPEVGEAFLAAWRGAGCVGAPDLVMLP
ncbi:MAG: glycosyltransferase family 39 protein [Thermomicrobiales bacterium]|nr:glycosyltransferase family 39 protein [Thermomicrobiales bacterium]